MESFAALVRILLHRIRAIQDSHGLPGEWPPSAAALSDRACGRIYRVRPTTWGVASSESSDSAAPNPRREPRRDSARRGLALTVYGLPVPRGLPST